MKLIVKICHNKITSRIGPPIKRKKKVSQTKAPPPPSFLLLSRGTWRHRGVGKRTLSWSKPAPQDAGQSARTREHEQKGFGWKGGRLICGGQSAVKVELPRSLHNKHWNFGIYNAEHSQKMGRKCRSAFSCWQIKNVLSLIQFLILGFTNSGFPFFKSYSTLMYLAPI